MKKVFVLLLTVLIMVSLVTGCGTTTGKKDNEKKEDVAQEFTFAGTNDVTTLDISLGNDEMSALVFYATNEALVRSYKDEIQMGIAEKYDVSEDGKVYTFHLRDAKWSDGKPVTAGDFEYSFFRTLDPKTGSSQVESFNAILNAQAYYNGEITDKSKVGIKAKDDKTLVITLTEENPFFIESLARGMNYYPIREDYVTKYGADYGSSADKYIGCGPFILAEWTQGSQIVMKKNDNYWNKDKIRLTKVTELIVADENTRVGMYDLGQIDAIYSISKTQTSKYPGYGNKSGGTLQRLVFRNGNGKALNNENLRLALSYALDRKGIVNAVSSPGTAVADRIIDPNIKYEGKVVADTYKATTGIPENGDTAKANEYLKKALKELGVSSAADIPEITYVCMDSATHKAMAEAIQEQWKSKLGIEVKISILPVPQAIGALLSGKFDIFLVSSSTSVNPIDDLTGSMTGNPNNYANWSNEEYTNIMNQILKESDVNVKLAKMAQAEQLLLNSGAVAPLWLPGTAYVSQDYVKNLYYGQETGSIEFIYSYIEK